MEVEVREVAMMCAATNVCIFNLNFLYETQKARTIIAILATAGCWVRDLFQL